MALETAKGFSRQRHFSKPMDGKKSEEKKFSFGMNKELEIQ